MPSPNHSRAGSRPLQVETHVFDAFKDYLNKYLDFVEAAEAETDAVKLKAIKDRQMAYLQYAPASPCHSRLTLT